MGNLERIALWVLVGLLAIGLVVSTVMITGELRAINDVLTEERTGELVKVTPQPETEDSPAQVGVSAAEVLSDTMTMTVTVRYAGQGDLLYEPPEAVDSSGQTYPITGESMEQARFAFLDLVTAGQVTTQLTFAGTPPSGETLMLVFNPNQPPSQAYVAPRVETPLPLSR